MAVIVIQVFLNFLQHLDVVVYDCVGSAVTVYSEEEITEDDSIVLEDLILVKIEVLASLVHQKFKQHFFVAFIDHSVCENSLVLMHP